MRDRIGNKLAEGNLVLWQPPAELLQKGLPVRVVNLSEPRLTVVDGTRHQGMLQLLVTIPLPPLPRNEEGQTDQILRLVDPSAEALVSKLVDGGPAWQDSLGKES